MIASPETARQVGINWWENDSWLSVDARRRPVAGKAVRGETEDGYGARELREENCRLRARISELEPGQ